MIECFMNQNIPCFRMTSEDFDIDFFNYSRLIIKNELDKIIKRYKYQKTKILIDSWTSNDMVLYMTVFSDNEDKLNKLFENDNVIDNILNDKNNNLLICFYFIGLDFSSFDFLTNNEIMNYLKNFKKIIKKEMDKDEIFKDVLSLREKSKQLNSLFDDFN